MPDPSPDSIAAFIARWEKSGASERANYQMFLSELCDLIGVARPDPTSPDPAKNLHVFDRAITRVHPDGSTTTNYIDLYKARHVVVETKQGADAAHPADPHLPAAKAPLKSGHGKRGTAAFDKALERAYHQGRGYITSLPAAEGRPPFLIVCDVGHTLDLYAEFSGTGGHYERFPDPVSHRITLHDLHRPEIRQRLRVIWTDPHSLDPSKHAAEVTRQVAAALAGLAKSLEADGHDPQIAAGFLQRCLFTMFAEDIGLLPGDGFLSLLKKYRDQPAGFPVVLQGLWKDMAAGAPFNVVLDQAVPYFNGGLFEDATILPLRPAQIDALIEAAKADWSAVEPAIFGTLLERALDPRERHKLGAHYTPRSYVERLVRPTVIQPLRDEWEAVKAAAAQLDSQGKDKDARAAVAAFHHRLCQLRVLDPACGSGNFLYVSLELLKRLEAEVLDLYQTLGGDRTFEMASFKVRPDQFLGLELNARAVAIAQLVLWIGYFQWQKRTSGKADTGDRPLLPKEETIRQQDAVLAYDAKVPRRDPNGEIVTVWNGHTTKTHPVTGKEVPDESARSVVFDYTHPRRAEWPQADFIVGNPPFLGASRMREALGDGYTESLRQAWKGAVPESADFVMFWWRKAAEMTRAGDAKRFGFITTNSIHQTFNRRVIEPFLADPKKPLHLDHAIPDHPWVDSADGAAVRIAMTVAAPGKGSGRLEKVIAEEARADGEHEVTLTGSRGSIAANLQIGADVTSCASLQANAGLSCPGVKLHGAGFIVSPEKAAELGYGTVPGIDRHLRGYRNGKDLTTRPRDVRLIDLFGLSDKEAAVQFPSLYQHVLHHVKPERDQNNRDTYRLNWWTFGEPRREFRPALETVTRYIATVETSKHRFFTFLDQNILPDNKLIAIASDDAALLAILSSSIHVCWALKSGSWLGVGNDSVYVKTRCFEPFPFPALDEGPLKQRLRDLGERLDAHRKDRQALHPELTLTGLYNVLEKLRSGEALNAKEKEVHDKGLVSVLKQIHDELDQAVLEAYGWQDLKRGAGGSPAVAPDHGRAAHAPLARPDEQELLTRLVALNHQRAAEESKGLIRWLRPAYQNPGSSAPQPVQPDLQGTAPSTLQSKIDHPQSSIVNPSALPWPSSLADQFAAILKLLPATGPDPAALAASFGKRTPKRVEQIAGILETLASMGKL